MTPGSSDNPSIEAPVALVDFPARPGEAHSPRMRLAFGRPSGWLVARSLADVPAVLDAAHEHAHAGRWCVGLVRYEAAPAFDAAMRVHAATGAPAVFAVFDTATEWPAALARSAPLHRCDPWTQTLDAAGFAAQLTSIQDAIRNGEVYQVNLTSSLRSHLYGAPRSLFFALLDSQPGGYALYLDTRGADAGDAQLLSVSPELFFHWQDGRLQSQPMKGTAPRGATPDEDAASARHLASSEKERAENLMIVDLLRNDFARIAELGSVRVPRLFDIHALPTVWQMTSTVCARTRAGLRLSEVFRALFPCGSVTGAPKIAAMRRIVELELEPRGVYCGALGLLLPGGAATFNVPIRTVELQPATDASQASELRCGVGSGITLDSSLEGEAGEWRAKRRFLERAEAPFALLESMRLQDGHIWLLDAHLARLQASAAALGHACQPAALRNSLAAWAQQHPVGWFKLRLLLDRDGSHRVELQPLVGPLGTDGPTTGSVATLVPPAPPGIPSTGPAQALSVALATQPVDAASDFVRHKTTQRRVYAPFAAPPGCFDTLLWNPHGELTEFTLGNVALLLPAAPDGCVPDAAGEQPLHWVTPDATCGLLPGTLRATLLDQGQIRMARLALQDLHRAQAAAFFNSVRGWLLVDLPALQQAADRLRNRSPQI